MKLNLEALHKDGIALVGFWRTRKALTIANLLSIENDPKQDLESSLSSGGRHELLGSMLLGQEVLDSDFCIGTRDLARWMVRLSYDRPIHDRPDSPQFAYTCCYASTLSAPRVDPHTAPYQLCLTRQKGIADSRGRLVGGQRYSGAVGHVCLYFARVAQNRFMLLRYDVHGDTAGLLV